MAGLRTKIQALTGAPLWIGEIGELGKVSIYPMSWTDQTEMEAYIVPDRKPEEYTPEEIAKASRGAVHMVWASLVAGEPDLTREDVGQLLTTPEGMALLAKVAEVIKERASSASFRLVKCVPAC